MYECKDAAAEKIIVNETDVTDVKIPPIVEEVVEHLCPNDCAFNGRCVNGACVCKKDYTAKDCSVWVYEKPHISRLVLPKCKEKNIKGKMQDSSQIIKQLVIPVYIMDRKTNKQTNKFLHPITVHRYAAISSVKHGISEQYFPGKSRLLSTRE